MIDEYDFNLLRMRFRELQEEVGALRRALEVVRSMTEQVDRICAGLAKPSEPVDER